VKAVLVRGIFAIVFMVLSGMAGASGRDFIILQSTTSTQNSGLLDAILPAFSAEFGIEVRVVAVGTGQALRNARNGDGDVLLVHAKQAEEDFVADGFGLVRYDVMYNDFVVVGPPNDPAGIAGSKKVGEALIRIAETQSKFASRGDDSGTHKAELRLWSAIDVAPQAASGRWYIETGSGMGATLNVAVGMSAYVLSDRATWLAFSNKGGHQILFEGDEALFNQYGVIAVSPERHPHVRYEQADVFVRWLTGPQGQEEIAAFRVAGQQLFFTNAQ